MKAPLTNFDFMNYYDRNSQFGGVFSRDNIPHFKDMFYVINLDGKSGPGTHWVVMYNVDRPTCIYFDSFGVDPQKRC